MWQVEAGLWKQVSGSRLTGSCTQMKQAGWLGCRTCHMDGCAAALVTQHKLGLRLPFCHSLVSTRGIASQCHSPGMVHSWRAEQARGVHLLLMMPGSLVRYAWSKIQEWRVEERFLAPT
jgi:hypothetical protein